LLLDAPPVCRTLTFIRPFRPFPRHRRSDRPARTGLDAREMFPVFSAFAPAA